MAPPSSLSSAFLPLLVLFPIYVTLNLTFLGDYQWSWLLLSLACGTPAVQHQTHAGTWFTYAGMQIFFGGFNGFEKPHNEVGRRVI
jgi:hypothetical protein